MNNTDYENTHRKLLTETELYMPDPFIFMNFFRSVVEAQNGKKRLYHPDGSPVDKKLVEDMYKHLTTNHENVYGGNNVGAWTWLNAYFPEVNIKEEVIFSINEIPIISTKQISGKIERVIGLNPDGTLKKDSRDLERCLVKKGFTSLDFNSQGLLIKQKGNKYQQGKNIYFYCLEQGRVARFGADSDGAVLDFGRDPDASASGLGVFGCAEGIDEYNGKIPKSGGQA
jgi:hypothetical protein